MWNASNIFLMIFKEEFQQWRIQGVWETDIPFSAPQKTLFKLNFNKSSDQWFHNEINYFEIS